jgi:DNA-binding MarR family transcriptional regulator
MTSEQGRARTTRDDFDPAPALDPFPTDVEERRGLQLLHRAVYRFTSSERRLTSRYKLAGGSLSPGRLAALGALLDQGEHTAGELAEEAGLRPASITPMLEQLERSGVIRRRRDENDHRVSLIALTDLGLSLVGERKAEWNHLFSTAFANTPDRELEIASRVLEQLADVFSVVARDDEESPGKP